MLDVFALLTLVAELDAAGGVAADLSAGHPAVAERFSDHHVLVHVAACKRKKYKTFLTSAHLVMILGLHVQYF